MFRVEDEFKAARDRIVTAEVIFSNAKNELLRINDMQEQIDQMD